MKEYNDLRSVVGSYLKNCPLKGFQPITEITVYFLVPGYPFNKDDFKSQYEKKPQRFKNQPNHIKCQAHGLSVYTDIKDVFKTQEMYDGRFEHHKIAVGKLTYESGVIKNTPAFCRKTHHTWWPFCNIDRSRFFLEYHTP